jgi:hypothetical protein
MSRVDYTCVFKPLLRTLEQKQVSIFLCVSAPSGCFGEDRRSTLRLERSSLDDAVATRWALHFSSAAGAGGSNRHRSSSDEVFNEKSRDGANTPAPLARCEGAPTITTVLRRRYGRHSTHDHCGRAQ